VVLETHQEEMIDRVETRNRQQLTEESSRAGK